MRKIVPALLTIGFLTACAKPAAEPMATTAPSPASTMPAAPAKPADDPAAYLAHEAYVNAINSNNIDAVLGMLTDDVVFMAPNEKPYIGKAALRPWIEGYLAAYKTHWDKPVQEFVVNGDWAYERYAYTSTDTPVAGGAPIVGTGWGLLIYHHDADGKWRVARDAWGSDQPVATK